MPNIKLKTLPTQDQTPVKKIEISILIEKEEDKFYLNFYSKKNFGIVLAQSYIWTMWLGRYTSGQSHMILMILIQKQSL